MSSLALVTTLPINRTLRLTSSHVKMVNRGDIITKKYYKEMAVWAQKFGHLNMLY